MHLIAIKIVDKHDAAGVAEARAALTGAGFRIAYEDDADSVLVDAGKANGGDNAYGGTWVIVGKKN